MVFRNTKKNRDHFKPIRPAYDERFPVFSFKDFSKDTVFYTKEHSNSDKNSLFNFLNASKDFCSIKWKDIKKNNQFHAHDVDVDISDLSHIEYPLFQFKLPNHDKGRFIGYFNQDCVFCLLIYDRNHEVYKRK
jgi:hypothetical protein